MYAAPVPVARSGAKSAWPLAAICCLGLLGFLIVATIVLALIPVYLPNNATPVRTGGARNLFALATAPAAAGAQGGAVQNPGALAGPLGVGANGQVVAGNAAPVAQRKRAAINRRQTFVMQFVFEIAPVLTAGCTSDSCVSATLSGLQQSISNVRIFTTAISIITASGTVVTTTFTVTILSFASTRPTDFAVGSGTATTTVAGGTGVTTSAGGASGESTTAGGASGESTTAGGASGESTTAGGASGESTTAGGASGESTTAGGASGESTTAGGASGESTTAGGASGESTTAGGASGESTTAGASGASGESTTAGASGASGASTSSGASGASGASTSSGASGASTSSGASGASGASTSSGASGASTSSGASGASTSSGASGASTSSGASGASTSSGASGASTSSGASGASTSSGASGSSGASTSSGGSTTAPTGPTPTSFTSAGSGSYFAAATWAGGIIPTGSIVNLTIATGHTVSIPFATFNGTITTWIISGTLDLGQGAATFTFLRPTSIIIRSGGRVVDSTTNKRIVTAQGTAINQLSGGTLPAGTNIEVGVGARAVGSTIQITVSVSATIGILGTELRSHNKTTPICNSNGGDILAAGSYLGGVPPSSEFCSAVRCGIDISLSFSLVTTSLNGVFNLNVAEILVSATASLSLGTAGSTVGFTFSASILIQASGRITFAAASGSIRLPLGSNLNLLGGASIVSASGAAVALQTTSATGVDIGVAVTIVSGQVGPFFIAPSQNGIVASTTTPGGNDVSLPTAAPTGATTGTTPRPSTTAMFG